MIKEKQALNQGLVLKEVHRVINFNQKDWLKSHSDMNTELKKMFCILKKCFQANEQCGKFMQQIFFRKFISYKNF